MEKASVRSGKKKFYAGRKRSTQRRIAIRKRTLNARSIRRNKGRKATVKPLQRKRKLPGRKRSIRAKTKRIRRSRRGPLLLPPTVQKPPPYSFPAQEGYAPVPVVHSAAAEVRPKLSIIVPILNEENFLPLFLESASSYADEVLIVDGGSTDASISIIQDWQSRMNIRLFHMKQTGLPYSDDWNESVVRNFLLDQASGDWIMALDADEMVDDRFRGELPRLLSQKEFDVIALPMIHFWMNPQTIRNNAPGDPHWNAHKFFLWRNHIGIRYDDAKNHCKAQLHGRNLWEIEHVKESIPLYHYHYAFGSRVKANDNRRRDMDQYLGRPVGHIEYAIHTEPFTGEHPQVMKRYFDTQHAV